MTDRQLRTLTLQIEAALRLTNSDGTVVSPVAAIERARDVVQILLPLLEQREADLVAHLRAMAGATLALGDAHTLIQQAADHVTDELEELLAGLPCELCGREIAEGEGAFEVLPVGPPGKPANGSRVMIACGRCEHPAWVVPS